MRKNYWVAVTICGLVIGSLATPVWSGEEKGSGTVTYTLGGNDAADFTINGSTGVVSMIARDYEAPADANTDNVYELTITATDSDGSTGTAKIASPICSI